MSRYTQTIKDITKTIEDNEKEKASIEATPERNHNGFRDMRRVTELKILNIKKLRSVRALKIYNERLREERFQLRHV